MSREWCVAVRPLPGATAAEIGRVKTALAEREPKFDFDFDRDGDEFFVYVDEPHNARRTERAIMHVLAERGVADRVAEPLPIGRWHENAYRYVFPGGDPEPVVPADEIGWVVVVRPASAFEWRPLRTALEHLGRTMIRETGHAIEIGARDGEDADALRAALADVACAGQTAAHPLTRFQRWRLRERLLGNYAGEFDPTQP